MKHVALQDAKARFGRLVAEAGEAPVIITRNGRDEAVLLAARPQTQGRVIQGKRGATGLYEALRAAPFELKLQRLRGRFRPVKL